ncbi:MAG: 6-carboxytetrahydropterin synthase [Planctomycetes bacterium]|nr:6-carboxytetrahydropterin synthase [Planctomycetota bacterium]
MTTCTRILEFDAAHRLVNHEGMCAHLHGHRYRAEIECAAPLDSVGRVIDFSVIKERVGGWIAQRWDHAAIVNGADERLLGLLRDIGEERVYRLDGNPTAENIAAELLKTAAALLAPIRVVRVRVWETPNCYAEVLG